MRLHLAIAALWLLGVSNALAQSEDWLVLPTTHDERTSWMEPTVSEVSRELRRQGVGVWSSGQAVVIFEQRGSAPPSEVTPTIIEAWEARSRAAVRQLALGEYRRALAELEAAQALSNAALEELNRDPERARTVLDTCLYAVRALLETGDDPGATAQARDCVRMAPNTEPTRYMHPPTVADLYSELASPGPENQSALIVESEPAGCLLRINGVRMGPTPFEVKNLYPGEYGAQVECDPEVRGRVHPIEVTSGRTAAFVVDRFERALQTKPLLHLRYAQPATAGQRVRDARELGRVLPAAAVVLASSTSAGMLELRLVSGARKDTAFARIGSSPEGPDAADVSGAVATLLSGQCRDLSGAEPITLDCATGQPALAALPAQTEERKRSPRPPHGQFIAGLTLASAGAASLLTGYALLAARSAAGDDWIAANGSLDANQKWLNLGTGLLVTGGAGAAMLVTAMPLVLPYKPKTPWWAWLSGGLGLGLTAGAIAVGVTADPKPAASCAVIDFNNAEPCVNRGKQTDLAIMLGVTAAPLLTMPLVYLFRKDEKRSKTDLSPGIFVHRSGGALSIHGAF